MNPDIEIISRANREETANKLLQVGANHTVMPFRALGLMAGEYIGRPVAFEAIHGMLYGKQKVGLETVMVSSGSILDGVSIGEIDFRAYKMILFGVITSEERSGGEGESVYGMKSRRLFFNPQRDFQLQGGEIIMVFGHELSIVHFKECLERGKIDLVKSS
jgi:voltage-gated potassium channel